MPKGCCCWPAVSEGSSQRLVTLVAHLTNGVTELPVALGYKPELGSIITCVQAGSLTRSPISGPSRRNRPRVSLRRATVVIQEPAKPLTSVNTTDTRHRGGALEQFVSRPW